MRIGHASISENGNSGRDGKSKPGDQNKKEVCIRNFYAKPWKYLLRCKDANKREIMAKACEAICNNDKVGYSQNQRNSLNTVLKQVGYDYNKINYPCETDCSAFMTVCARCAGIEIPYNQGNAPTTSTMVKIFQSTGMFDVITDGINEEVNLIRGDILVGPPASHTVMVLDNGYSNQIQKRRVLRRGMSGSDVILMQQILCKEFYPVGEIDGIFGKKTENALKQFQAEKQLSVDGVCGPKTWSMLERYN